MTTAITIDAHAGWDVEVKMESLDSDGNVSGTVTKVVTKFTKETVYIHSHLRLTLVRELSP